MADFKAFWQQFKSGENGGKGQKDRSGSAGAAGAQTRQALLRHCGKFSVRQLHLSAGG